MSKVLGQVHLLVKEVFFISSLSGMSVDVYQICFLHQWKGSCGFLLKFVNQVNYMDRFSNINASLNYFEIMGFLNTLLNWICLYFIQDFSIYAYKQCFMYVCIYLLFIIYKRFSF